MCRTGKNDLPAFENQHPRAFVNKISQLAKTSPNARKFLRAEAANQNAFETIGLFAAAIVAGNVAGLGSKTLNALAGGYLASRAVYNILYVNVSTSALGANLRSIAYVSSIGIIATAFIKAGNAFNKLL